MTAPQTQWHIIGRGRYGWHAAAPDCTSSGGDIESRNTIPPYLASAFEDAPVYDASNADPDAYESFTFNGPMVTPALPADGWRKFGHDDDAPRALDSVGVERYIALLRAAVPGVRFGRVHNAEIVWSD